MGFWNFCRWDPFQDLTFRLFQAAQLHSASLARWPRHRRPSTRHSDCQNNGNYCTQLQDASNYNTYRYSRSIGEQGLLSLTTDLIGGSTGNYIYDNISVNEYQCVIATSATGNYLYHNTFAGFSYRGFANNSGTFGVVENNIFWTTVPGAQTIFTSAGTGFTSNFNIYGTQQSNFIYSEGTHYSTLSAWGQAGAVVRSTVSPRTASDYSPDNPTSASGSTSPGTSVRGAATREAGSARCLGQATVRQSRVRNHEPRAGREKG